MANGRASSRLGLGALHDRGDPVLELVVALGGHEEGHAAAGHAAEHQEAPEVVAQGRAGLADDRLGELVGHPGDDPLERTVPVAGRPPAQAPDVRLARRRRRSPRRSRALPGGRATPRPRSRYLAVTMLRIGPTFWAMPPWTRTRLLARASEKDADVLRGLVPSQLRLPAG